MRATLLSFAVFVASLPFALAGGGGYSDVCGECRGTLTVPSYSYPDSRSDFGDIGESFLLIRCWRSFCLTLPLSDDCLCLSDLPNYVSSNPIAISAVSYGGRDAVTNALSSLVGFYPLGEVG